MKILVVGDGDLSYSAALSQKVKETGDIVWGSVLPDRDEMVRLYGKEVVEAREAALGGRVLYKVDLTDLKLADEMSDVKFDEVHFNYPHLGYSQQAERGGKWSRAPLHIAFFASMFKSLRRVQTTSQKMLLTLTPTPPYSIKSVKESAITSGYVFDSEHPFDPSEYPGYHPAWGDDRDILKPSTSSYGAKGRQLIFENCCCEPCGIICKGKEQIEQHVVSSRHQRTVRKRKAEEKLKAPKRARFVLV
eukprot:TRINITY_DN34230_c0_g1_i1.p1 TRINITY_DN34230_c0_g1~~TRINITY_DN34230_c0_g1_i1.p1  ORF type:complete len:265 (+),score=40.22 TRINITY_DN34230_c0_g1_i1:55-795(+)